MANPADAYYYYPTVQEKAMETGMIDQAFMVLDKYGVSFFTVICAFYFIVYLTKQSANERAEFLKKDSENDERLMKIVESSSDALLHVKVALEQNTQAMREFIRYRN